MKFIHTADWHLGKIVHQKSMIEDQRILLNQLLEFMKKDEITVLVIAGDIYDRSIPTLEAINLLNEFLDKAINHVELTVLMIAGNHDGVERLNFASNILKTKGLYIESLLEKEMRKVVLTDALGPVNFYLLPFFKPSAVRFEFGEMEINEFDEAMNFYLAANPIDPNERNVLVTHQFVAGSSASIESESEMPLSVGGSSQIAADRFSAFDYVALGHLHAPQSISKPTIRYSGSLLKYSGDEAHQKKGINLVELNEKGNITITPITLSPIRDLRKLKGKFDDLLFHPIGNQEDYIVFELTDESMVINAMEKARSVYPNTMTITYAAQTHSLIQSTTKARSLENVKDEIGMFQEFYASIMEESFDDEMNSLLTEIVAGVREAHHETD